MKTKYRVDRLFIQLCPEVQMAIKLRSVKESKRIGDVVGDAIRLVFPEEIKEAKEVLSKNKSL